VSRSRPPSRAKTLARAPAGLTVSTVGAGVEEIAIFSFPLAAGGSPLTTSESQVVVALLAGKRNAEIARARGTSTRTIANQVASIYCKLGVRSRAQLIAHAAILLGRSGSEEEE
jgi:DNA-binding NarL/FixJ family response regulator